jgi:hypothetical protein
MLKIGLTFLSALLFSGAAVSADFEAPTSEHSGIYGRVYVGMQASQDEIFGEKRISPFAFTGGRVASNFEASPWGWQADADFAYADLDWLSPNVGGGLEGDSGASSGRLHLTYGVWETTKLGVYAGMRNSFVSLNDAIGYADRTELEGELGLEMMHQVGHATWISGYAGLNDSFRRSLDVYDGVNSASRSDYDFLGNVYSGVAGMRLNHQFTEMTEFQFDVRGSATYDKYGDNSQFYGVYAAVIQQIGETPLDVVGRVGFTSQSDEDWHRDPYAAIQLNWHFGGPAQGSSGRLF